MLRLQAALAAIAVLAVADCAPENRANPISTFEGRSAQAPMEGAPFGLAQPVTARPEAGGPARIVSLEAGARRIHLADLKGASRVVLIWRSDCAPCLAELQQFNALEAATGAGRLVTVSLEPPETARAALARLNVTRHPAYVAAGDAQTFLETVSNGGQRLPFAIALDRHGRICARRVGLLGIERARAWIAQC